MSKPTIAKQTISHATISRSLLAEEIANAKLDPDRAQFPWRDMYPMVGTTVWWGGALWTIDGQVRRNLDDSTTMLELSRQRTGLDDRATAFVPRMECRPVTWTQADEDRL